MDSTRALAERSPARPRRRRARRSRPRARRTATGPLLTAHLGALLLGSVLAIGTVHRLTLLVVAVFACAGVAWARAADRWRSMPAVSLAFGVAAYCLVQSAPLPIELLRALAPASADVWARALLPFGEEVTWGSLSIDRGASLAEALEWITYAATFGLAASVGREHGAPAVATLVFSSAVVLALVTLAHGLLDASRVFGIYKPTFTPTRWVTSPLLNPNNLAGYLNLGTFAGLGLLLSSRTSWSRASGAAMTGAAVTGPGSAWSSVEDAPGSGASGPETDSFDVSSWTGSSTWTGSRRGRSSVARWAVALGTALLMGQTVLAASRGGLLALFGGWTLVALLVPRVGDPRERRRRIWSWPVACALAGGVLLALVGAQRTTWDDLRQEGLEKLAVIEWVTPLVADHLWFGVGAGAFEAASPRYRPEGGSLWAHPENFALAWVAEWGVPVGLGTLLALLWTFRPRRLGAHRSRLAATLAIGVAVVCLQNLVDLAFALPGVFIAVAAALGGLWGARDGSVDPPARASAPRTAWLLVGAGALSCVLVIFGGLRSAHADRRELARAYDAAELTDPRARDAFYAQLRGAMARHPGEAFFPRLGALAARHTPGATPLPWIGRVLERDPRSGRMHLLLAETLARRGARSQALLHLRLATEHEPGLAPSVARLALAWAKDLDDVERAVPEHQGGAVLLSRLAVTLSPKDPERGPWRRRFLEDALTRDPTLGSARVTLIRDLLREGATEAAAEHLARLRATDPGNVHAVELEGSLLAARGEQQAAIAFLLERCPRRDSTCLRRAVELSAATDDLPLDAPSQAYLAAACRTQAACGDARLWIGDLHARRQLWGPALAHYAGAAGALETAAAWLRVADAASRQGAHGRALAALRRAETRVDAEDERAARHVEARRREIMERASRSGSAPSAP